MYFSPKNYDDNSLPFLEWTDEEAEDGTSDVTSDSDSLPEKPDENESLL
jgi:hypothetical protein